MNLKNNSVRQYLLVIVAGLLLVGATAVQADWTFDSDSNTFVLDPSLVSGDVFEHMWKADSQSDPNNAVAPTEYLYEHDMSFQTSSWYGGTWWNLRSYAGWTGAEAAATSNRTSPVATG